MPYTSWVIQIRMAPATAGYLVTTQPDKDKILGIANGPGEQILPGQLGHAMELIAAGKAIDYDGASGVMLVGAGESAGRYKEFVVKGGKYETVKFR